MKKCLALLLEQPESAQVAFAERVERHLRMGLDQKQSMQMAAQLMMDDIKAEAEMVEKALREQHPDLFTISPERQLVEAPRQSRAHAFTLPAFEAEDAFLSSYDPARPVATILPASLAAAKAQLAQAQEAIQDRYNRWKQTIEAVREQGGVVNEVNDFYAAEERYWGAVGRQNETFGREVERFVEAVQADGLELDDVALYAYAKHAPERNRYIASKRPDMQDGGSGMTDEEADAITAAAEQSGLHEALERHAGTLQQWIEGTRDILESGGLITPETRQAWERGFVNYVPLRGREGSRTGLGYGHGFGIKGPESKRALGRRSQAKQIIEQIIQERSRALIRSGKNEVLRSFLAFVLDNPSPNLWAVEAVEPKTVVRKDDEGNEVFVTEERPVVGRNVITIKDGGQEVRVLVKDEALLRQLKGLDEVGVGRVIGAMQWANRKVGAMLTVYNPVFTVMNGMRDFQAATVGMVQQFGAGGAIGFARQYGAALREAMRAELGGKPSGDYQLFKTTGATTGYALMGDLKATEDELRRLMSRAQSRNVAMKTARKALAYIEGCNSMVENATRFAAWQAARKRGASLTEAASIAKNITVNFNRKGTKTPWLSAFVLFWNPAIQGSARIAQNMASPQALSLVGAGMVGAFMLALGNAEWGGEDDDGVSFWDKVPDEVKERNIVIMSPFGPTKGDDGSMQANYIKLPMAYGYNTLKVFADQLADQLRRSRDITAGRPAEASAIRVASALVTSLQPINALGQSLEDSSSLAMLPYSNALGPVFQAAANRSSFGRQLHPDTPNTKHLPDSQKYSASQAGTVFQRGAERLNTITGGSDFESGWLDISPGALENAVRFYGGGIAQFGIDLANAFYARQHLERETPELQRLPFAKQLLGQINAETDRAGFDRLRQADRATQPFDAALRAGDADAADAVLRQHGPIAGAGNAVARFRGVLAELRRAELAVIDDEAMSDAEKLKRLREIQGEVRHVLGRWNEVFDSLAREAEQDKANRDTATTNP